MLKSARGEIEIFNERQKMTKSDMQKARDSLVNTMGLRKQEIERLKAEYDRDMAIVKLFDEKLGNTDELGF